MCPRSPTKRLPNSKNQRNRGSVQSSMSTESDDDQGRNGYLDLVRGTVPEEIAAFGIGNDPSANVLGTRSSTNGASYLRVVRVDEPDEDEDTRRGHPLLTAISLVLIVVWIVVPAGLLILTRTGTWP